MARVGIHLGGYQQIYGEDLRRVLDLAKRAEQKGIDQIALPDHVAMSISGYKAKGTFPYPLEAPWPDPIATLSAIAGVTEKITLSTNVLVGPLRPAILLAKQFATLDRLSNGRVHIGLGAGWQTEEFDASAIDIGKKRKLLEEQVKVCRLLWSQAPASFAGETIRFTDFYSLPFPAQRDRVPFSFGLPISPRNAEMMAQLGVGWSVSVGTPLPKMAGGLALLRKAYETAGRDPYSLEVRIAVNAVRTNGRLDIEATRASVAAIVAAGATTVETTIRTFCHTPDDVDPMLDWLAAFRRTG